MRRYKKAALEKKKSLPQTEEQRIDKIINNFVRSLTRKEPKWDPTTEEYKIRKRYHKKFLEKGIAHRSRAKLDILVLQRKKLPVPQKLLEKVKEEDNRLAEAYEKRTMKYFISTDNDEPIELGSIGKDGVVLIPTEESGEEYE